MDLWSVLTQYLRINLEVALVRTLGTTPGEILVP